MSVWSTLRLRASQCRSSNSRMRGVDAGPETRRQAGSRHREQQRNWESIARLLAQAGAAVVVHGRNAERAERVADDINKQKGGKAWVALGDLATEEGADRVASRTLETLGGIDILVNNAGGADEGMKPWLETPIDEWKHLFEQNIFSAVRLIRRFVPEMKKSGWGRVIQISSGAASQPLPIGPGYAAAKAAMVNTVSPGPILTPIAERVFREIAKTKGWGDEWAEIEPQAVKSFVPNPVGRFGSVEEVAAAVAFLASPLASFINGANLRVDGGYVTAIN